MSNCCNKHMRPLTYKVNVLKHDLTIPDSFYEGTTKYQVKMCVFCYFDFQKNITKKILSNNNSDTNKLTTF